MDKYHQHFILDLGCGDGTNGPFLTRLGYHYIGIDISEAAIKRARRRAGEAGLTVDFRVGNVLDLSEFQADEFPIVLDCFCLHMLVFDTHRAAYFGNVKRILQEDGFLVLQANRDETAHEGPIASFEAFCRRSGLDPLHLGIPFQKNLDGQWVNVEGKEAFLLGRGRSLRGYKKELRKAGFRIMHQSTFGRNRRNVAFVLEKCD